MAAASIVVWLLPWWGVTSSFIHCFSSWRSPLEGVSTAGSGMPHMLNPEPFSPLWLMQTSLLVSFSSHVPFVSGFFLLFSDTGPWSRNQPQVLKSSWTISSFLPEGFLDVFYKLILLSPKVLHTQGIIWLFATSNKNPVTPVSQGWPDNLHN